MGNAYTRPLGYVFIWVQLNEVQGYDEDQIAVVIPDLSNFVAQIPVILGTHTISHIINLMKKVEIDALVMSWMKARVAYLLLVCRMMAMKVSDDIAEKSSSDDCNQVMFTQNVETIEAFSSCMELVKVGRAYTGQCINIMVQALQMEDGSLPQGLTIQNTYTELRWGSKKAVVVVRNSMAYPQTLQKKTLVARAVAAFLVPEPPKEDQLQKEGDEPQDCHTLKLTVWQRHGKLFDELDWSG